MKNIFIALIILSLLILSCDYAHKIDPCLEALEIVSTSEDANGIIRYEVVGTVETMSKGAHDLEIAIRETLDLPKGVVAGCLIFEENHSDYFGYFMFDSRRSVDYPTIKLKERVKVTLRRVKLDKIIPSDFQNGKRVEFLYLIQDVEAIEK